MGFKSVKRMSWRSLMRQRNKLQNRLGTLFGYRHLGGDSARLATICREIGRRLVKIDG